MENKIRVGVSWTFDDATLKGKERKEEKKQGVDGMLQYTRWKISCFARHGAVLLPSSPPLHPQCAKKIKSALMRPLSHSHLQNKTVTRTDRRPTPIHADKQTNSSQPPRFPQTIQIVTESKTPIPIPTPILPLRRRHTRARTPRSFIIQSDQASSIASRRSK